MAMKVRDLMTTSVVSVEPAAPVTRVAQTLLDHGISAVPVVADGVPIGIVGEGDILSRCSGKGRMRRDWFARLMAGGDARLEFVDSFETICTARDVMSAPVITTTEGADIAAISSVMLAQRIKRLPVVRGGRIVGIISRADLLRVVAASRIEDPASEHPHSALAEVLLRIDEIFHRHARSSPEAAGGGANGADGAARMETPHVFTASELRASVAHHKQHEVLAKAEERRLRRERTQRDIASLLDTHLTEDTWRHMLLDASHAAERGERELQLLRMPHEACTDNGRMINIGDHEWPSTLRGEAAELWQRWSKELRPRGLRLVARTLEYPDGVPGDIGLFLVWGGE
jgi:CBS domain-containing protein